MIDDAAYAARLVRTRFAEKGAARRAIAEELRRKGLEEQNVAAALGQIDSDDEDAAALALARKKLIATRHLPWEVRRRRTAAMLGRKGYSREVTMRAIEDALAEGAGAERRSRKSGSRGREVLLAGLLGLPHDPGDSGRWWPSNPG